MSFGQVLYQKPLKTPPSPSLGANLLIEIRDLSETFPNRESFKGDNDDVEVLNKQIQSGTSGEVFIQPADAKSNCIEGGNLVPGNARICRMSIRFFSWENLWNSKLRAVASFYCKVWVLQGSCLDIQQDKGCSLAVPCRSTFWKCKTLQNAKNASVKVQQGDQLAARQAIIQEWAQTKQQGVPRFQARRQKSERQPCGEAVKMWRKAFWFELIRLICD